MPRRRELIDRDRPSRRDRGMARPPAATAMGMFNSTECQVTLRLLGIVDQYKTQHVVKDTACCNTERAFISGRR